MRTVAVAIAASSRCHERCGRLVYSCVSHGVRRAMALGRLGSFVPAREWRRSLGIWTRLTVLSVDTAQELRWADGFVYDYEILFFLFDHTILCSLYRLSAKLPREHEVSCNNDARGKFKIVAKPHP